MQHGRHISGAPTLAAGSCDERALQARLVTATRARRVRERPARPRRRGPAFRAEAAFPPADPRRWALQLVRALHRAGPTGLPLVRHVQGSGPLRRLRLPLLRPREQRQHEPAQLHGDDAARRPQRQAVGGHVGGGEPLRREPGPLRQLRAPRRRRRHEHPGRRAGHDLAGRGEGSIPLRHGRGEGDAGRRVARIHRDQHALPGPGRVDLGGDAGRGAARARSRRGRRARLPPGGGRAHAGGR